MRAADLIGQLGDPNYMRKANALFYEFEETGMNKTLGYDTPADVIYKYPQFYWTHVAPQVQAAIRYLNVTSSGRQWIANLYSNVFRAEREVSLSGPQMRRAAVRPKWIRAECRHGFGWSLVAGAVVTGCGGGAVRLSLVYAPDHADDCGRIAGRRGGPDRVGHRRAGLPPPMRLCG